MGGGDEKEEKGREGKRNGREGWRDATEYNEIHFEVI